MDTNHGNGNTNSSSSNDDSLIKLLDQHTNAFGSLLIKEINDVDNYYFFQFLESIESLTTI